MPQTEIYFYQEENGSAPVLVFLEELRTKEPKAYAKCRVKIERLEEVGHELRRPEADYLQDGVYELRARHRNVNYRILYFFHGKNVAILNHAITKEGEIPLSELERATRRKSLFESFPEIHTFRKEGETR